MESAADDALALPPGKLLKRADVARKLGVSLSSVRRMEGVTLHPIIGPAGVRYFLDEHVETAFQRLQREGDDEDGEASGSLAAQVFERFRAGMNPVDVVRELHIEPRLIEQLMTHWQRFSTTMLLRDTEVQQLRRALHSNEISDGAAFLAAITTYKRGAIDHCDRCGDARALYCRECAREVGQRALRQEAANRLF